MNAVYIPTAHKSGYYLRIASNLCVRGAGVASRKGHHRAVRRHSRAGSRHSSALPSTLRSLLGSFTVFIIMGILGEFAGSARSTVIALCVVAFLLGMAAFMYSKWIEQPGIRLGADAVKKLLDEKINPRYGRSEFKLRWSVRRSKRAPGLLVCVCGGGGERGGERSSAEAARVAGALPPVPVRWLARRSLQSTMEAADSGGNGGPTPSPEWTRSVPLGGRSFYPPLPTPVPAPCAQVAVRVQRKKAIHAGRAFMERPVLTLWALRSANADGVVVDWPVPEALLSRVFVEDSDIKVVGVDGSK